MTIVINNGMLIDPENKIYSKLNLLIDEGKIQEIAAQPLRGDTEIDAAGLYVTPGFVDLHMHEDPLTPEGIRIRIFERMLRMGVTTAIGGNCGIGRGDPATYLEHVDRGIPVNFGMFLPHELLRQKVGATDRYAHATPGQIAEMVAIGRKWMNEAGLMGVSFGIRYVPGANDTELKEIAKLGAGKTISAHVRDDAANIFPAIEEFLTLADDVPAHFQISHIGSMAGFGQMASVYATVDALRAQKHYAVSFDCYPYAAFSTSIGSTTFDDGFLKRYGIDYELLEVAEGPHKGERCTEELFQRLRKTAPGTMMIAHVMRESEIAFALANPDTVVASDGILGDTGDGHPRAAGTFPRFLSRYVRDQKICSLFEGIKKITSDPAHILGIPKGSLGVGDDADIVLFSLEKLADHATFAESDLAPEGIYMVIVNGEIALKKGKIIRTGAGKSVRK
ncbi:MAG: amidohydrolase family protein [Fusobacteriaceae bacterium]|jgi:N-acyl-D-amino-acid deacylase|nr:amidohydrolase family protein [Fusobacteriaceae bacterium]